MSWIIGRIEEMERELKERWKKQLKPCPFCGGHAVLLEQEHEWTDTISYQVVCVNETCLVGPQTSYCNRPEAAIDAWNTRHDQR